MSMTLIPNVITQEGNRERVADIYSTLLEQRIVFVQGQVCDEMANTIVAQLLFLESIDPTEPITLYINSPGGSVTAGLAIKDTMDCIKCPVHTVAMGMAASMGAFLLASGEPGHRAALKNTTVMIHQVLGGFQGQATDIEIHAKYTLELKERLNRYLSEYTQGKVDYETMVSLCERDNFLSSQEALELGLIDEIIDQKGDNK